MALRLLKVLFLCFIIFFIYFNSFANVIYDKNNIIISELDLVIYKKFHNERYNVKISDTKALKDLVMIKNLVISLEINNPDFIKTIDRDISMELGINSTKSKIHLDIIRYFKTKNYFIINYFNNNFKLNELEEVFNKFNKLELPLSDNNCLTMTDLLDLKNNNEFYEIFFNNLNKENKIYEISIDGKLMSVCLNQRNYQIIQEEIFKYIESKIQKDFDKFFYAQQKT